MRIPIQYALTHPQTQKFNFPLDLTKVDLSFSKVDHERYPAFSCIVEGGRIGGTMPAALNAADEVLVERFLRGEIAFTDISRGLQKVLEHHQVVSNPNLEEILAADRWGREYVG
jgi:1-deoxy-D-xylulose-5-phosphate reductoisomerase